MTKSVKNLVNLTLNELNELQTSWDSSLLEVASNMIMLSYVKSEMQPYIKEKGTSEDVFKKNINNELLIDLDEDCFKAYQDMNHRNWTYLTFTEDKETGYEAIAYANGPRLVVGIAGSDKSKEDWIDNDARLLIPKGDLIPTQFKVVGKSLLKMIETYRGVYGRYPKEILITGNSLGGAVTMVGYTELFSYCEKHRIKLRALTYNSAPLRSEYLEAVLQRQAQQEGMELTPGKQQKFYKGIVHFINEDDLLNNILYTFIKNMDTFGHVGKYIIIENKGLAKGEDLLHYAKEHLSVQSLRTLTVSKSQTIEKHAKSMIIDSRELVRKNIQNKIDFEIDRYQRGVELLDQIRGGFLGLAIGDAFGSPEGITGNPTDLTLAVAKGISAEPKDPLLKIGGQLVEWLALNDKGAGKTTRLAIENAIKKDSFPTGAKIANTILNGRTAGSGSLIRVLPIPLFYKELDEVVTLAGLQSNMTNFDPKAKEACQLYSWLVHQLLHNANRDQALSTIFGDHLYYGQYKKLELQELPVSDYVVETLLTGITLFYRSHSLKEGMELLQALPGDKRGAGAIAGSLLGVYFGMKSIPNEIRKTIHEIVEILSIAGLLYDQRIKEI